MPLPVEFSGSWGRGGGLQASQEPPLTCSSSHHMLTPPLATLSERTKFNLSGLMRRVQVLASLAIMLLTPIAKGSSKELTKKYVKYPKHQFSEQNYQLRTVSFPVGKSTFLLPPIRRLLMPLASSRPPNNLGIRKPRLGG